MTEKTCLNYILLYMFVYVICLYTFSRADVGIDKIMLMKKNVMFGHGPNGEKKLRILKKKMTEMTCLNYILIIGGNRQYYERGENEKNRKN